MQLLAQPVNALTGCHEPPLTDHRPPTSRFPTVIQTKTGPGVNPMPPLRFLTASAHTLGFAPLVPLPNVPGIQLDDHLIRRQYQFGLHRLCRGLTGSLILLATDVSGPLSLSAGFPIQRGSWQLDSRQMFQHRAGFAHGHLAGQQRCHLLNPRRVARTLLQAQNRIGRTPPLAAAFAVAPTPSNDDRAKPAFKAPPMVGTEPTQGFVTHRTNRGGQIRLLLRRFLGRLAQQFPALVFQFQLDVPQVLFIGEHEVSNLLFQGLGQPRCGEW